LEEVNKVGPEEAFSNIDKSELGEINKKIEKFEDKLI